MADRHPLANQNAVYQQDYHRITEMFQAATTQEDAHELFVELDSTLTDPLLPWQFRAEYSIMRAMYSGDDAQAYVEAAEEAVADIVEVYCTEGRDEEVIEQDLEGITDAIQAGEDGDPLPTRAELDAASEEAEDGATSGTAGAEAEAGGWSTASRSRYEAQAYERGDTGRPPSNTVRG